MSPSDVTNPFDQAGISRGEDGIARYDDLPRNLVTMLRASVERAGDRLAVAEVGGERLTYSELWDRAERVAGGLRQSGAAQGDRVAIKLGNGVDWVVAFCGCQLAGVVAVPVNTRLAPAEADYVVNDCGATVVLDGELPIGEPLVVDDAEHSDLAGIFYTSGTTGFPKGAMTTHENFLSNAESCRRAVSLPRDSDDLVTLVSVPLFHVTGCNSQLLTAFAYGWGCVVMPEFNVQTFLRTIADERINMLTTVPAIYWLAVNQPNFADFDLSCVRWLSYGGAPIAPDLVRELTRRFPEARVGNGFGLSETASLSTYLPHEYAADHADSVGFAVPVVDLQVEAPDPDGVGELLIRGPNVVAGYWNKPTETAESFTDGWLHTGDLARLDDEGLTYIVDRKKDMINRGGENVYCVEVENALAGAPGVLEVSVLGVPDPMMGEKVGAVVVPAPGSSFDPAALVAHAREHLADFKVPQYVAVRGEPLPRNPGGKVRKPLLRDETEWGAPLR